MHNNVHDGHAPNVAHHLYEHVYSTAEVKIEAMKFTPLRL